MDESTLEALEKELDRLKKYHEVNLAIFSKVNEWQKAWEHVLQVRGVTTQTVFLYTTEQKF